MRKGRLVLTEQDDRVFVDVQSLLVALREVPRHRDVASEIEIAVLRAQVANREDEIRKAAQDYMQDKEYRDTGTGFIALEKAVAA